MANQSETEEFIEGSEACRLLGVKPATLYAYVSRGILKSYKQGIKRQRLYRKSEILQLLAVRPSDQEPPAPEAKEKEGKKTDIPAAEDWIPYF
ncbi:MAG TPA: helix-turn-helix domain-containing protein [Chloroflexia bacterium]|nr:helix-turn-helix domain-containing protein [Chloroflexia bacterium]